MPTYVPPPVKYLIVLLTAMALVALILSPQYINNRSAQQASASASAMPAIAPAKPLTAAQQKCANSIRNTVKPVAARSSTISISGGPGCIKKGTTLYVFTNDSYNNSPVVVTAYQRPTNGSFKLTTEPIASASSQRNCGALPIRLAVAPTETEFSDEALTFGGDKFPKGMKPFAPLPSFNAKDPHYSAEDCR